MIASKSTQFTLVDGFEWGKVPFRGHFLTKRLLRQPSASGGSKASLSPLGEFEDAGQCAGLNGRSRFMDFSARGVPLRRVAGLARRAKPARIRASLQKMGTFLFFRTNLPKKIETSPFSVHARFGPPTPSSGHRPCATIHNRSTRHSRPYDAPARLSQCRVRLTSSPPKCGLIRANGRRIDIIGEVKM